MTQTVLKTVQAHYTPDGQLRLPGDIYIYVDVQAVGIAEPITDTNPTPVPDADQIPPVEPDLIQPTT